MALTKIEASNVSDDAVNIAQLGATGTPSATTFLRGDNTWTEVGGNTVFISKQTASDDASLAFTSGFSTIYHEYLFKIDNLKPASDTVALHFYLSNDAGSSYYTSEMYSISWYANRSPSASTNSDAIGATSWNSAYSFINWDQGNDAGTDWRAISELRLYRADVAEETAWQSISSQFEATNIFSLQLTAGSTSGAAEVVNAIKFQFASGNITSGDIRMYGVKAE